MLTRFCTPVVVLALITGCATPSATIVAEKAAVAPPALAVASPLSGAAETARAQAPTAPADAEPAAGPMASVPLLISAPAPAPAPVAASPVQERPAVAAPEQETVAKPKASVVEKKPAPVVADAQTLKGRLDLLAGPRQSVAAGEITEGLVYFLPAEEARAPKPGRFSITTHSKGFTPNHLVVPVGSTVSFPNRDDILHNVYSRTPGAAFDLGTFAPGETRQTVLNKAGLVIVNCNVHPAMRANVVVMATPYYTRPGKDGSFELRDLPNGPGTLVFWHPRANAGTLPIKSGRSAPVVLRLSATKARLQAPTSAGN